MADHKKTRKRKGGVPLGVYHSKMAVPPGTIASDKTGKWINDVDNGITNALNADWEFVMAKNDTHIGDGHKDNNTDLGQKISMLVGTEKTGEPQKAYLMEIYTDWYEEDQIQKQAGPNAFDKAIMDGGYKSEEKGLAKSATYGNIKYKP